MKTLSLGVTMMALALPLASSACKSSSASTTAPTPTDSAGAMAAPTTPPAMPAGSGSSVPSPLAIPGATVAALPNMSIPERFSMEASGRPAGTKPSVEEVYAGLEKAGIKIVDRQQHLASPFGARYCMGARAVTAANAPMLRVSVCEFITADAARVGRDYSAVGMKSIPFRTVYANKQTTLTLREDKQTPEGDALVEKAAAAYAAL